MSMTNTTIRSSITLRELKLKVFLGWPKAERIKRQRIYVDIHVHFAEPPIGCLTDNLEDTFCYAELTQKIEALVVDREFHLVEYLGHEIYQTVKKSVAENASVMIHLTKKPAVLKHITNGVTFSYGDR